MDCSPLGSSVHGILLVEILEWVAISFSSVSVGIIKLTWDHNGLMTSVLIKTREIWTQIHKARTMSGHRGDAVWWQRQRLEWWRLQDKDGQGLLAATRRWLLSFVYPFAFVWGDMPFTYLRLSSNNISDKFQWSGSLVLCFLKLFFFIKSNTKR